MTAPYRRRFVTLHQQLADVRAGGARRHGRELIDLSRPEPIAAHLAMHPDATAAWTVSRRYLPTGGAPHVREQVAAHLGEEMALPLTREHVAVVCGGNAALTSAIAALASHGEEVILPVPYYPPSPSQIELSGATPVLVRCETEGQRLTPSLLADAVTPRTAAVLLTSPVNPTGVLYTARELAEFDAVLPARVAWVIDEAYADFVLDGRPRPCAASTLWATTRRWLVLRTASKTVGRPGLRVAMLIGSPDVIDDVASVLKFTAGAASSFAQTAISSALRSAALAASSDLYAERLELALAALAGTGLCPQRPEGSYYLWVHGPDGAGPIGTVAFAASLCGAQAVFVSPGVLYGDPGGVRLSLSCSASELRDGVARLGSHAASLFDAAAS